MFTRIVRIVSITVGFAFAAVGLVVIPAGAFAGWSMLALAIGASAGLAVGEFPLARKLIGTTRSAATIGVVAGICVLAAALMVSGLVVVAGGTAAGSILVVVVTAWVGWRFWLAPAAAEDVHRAPPAPVLVADIPQPVGVAGLSTDELCLAWRRSYVELMRATDELARQRVVRSRREYLDELERRDRDGFARWLGSGARAGSDPQRYLAAGG